jgi:hypothetical protein
MRRFLGLRTTEQAVRSGAVGQVVSDEILRASSSFAEHAVRKKPHWLRQRHFWPLPSGMKKFALIMKA